MEVIKFVDRGEVVKTALGSETIEYAKVGPNDLPISTTFDANRVLIAMLNGHDAVESSDGNMRLVFQGTVPEDDEELLARLNRR